MSGLSQKDIDIWKEWKKDPTDPNRTKDLLDQTQNIRFRAVSNWQGSVSPITLNSEAVKLSIKAFGNFDPKKGVQLSTHLTNSLKKLSRLGYSEVSFLRMPEERQMKYMTFDTARNDLKERLGRDPSPMELADELGWRLPEVQRFLSEDRKVLMASGELPAHMEPASQRNDVDPNNKVHAVLADMHPIDQQIFRYTTGYGGSPILDGKSLLKEMDMKQSQLSYRKQVIADTFKGFGVGVPGKKQ